MGAGAKSELVTVERETRTPDGGGGSSSSWAAIGQLWAEVAWIGGAESSRQGAVREVGKYRFRVLAGGVLALGVLATDRMVWNGARYNIRELPQRPRKPEIDIIAETGVTQ